MLLVWLTTEFVPLKNILSRILWTAIVVLAILKPIVTQTRWKEYLDLPTGRTVFFQPETYEKAKWVSERTQPSDYFFGDMLLCFALGLRNPARVSFLTSSDYTRPEEVRDVVQALEERQVTFVNWYPGLDRPLHTAGNNLAPLTFYLHDHYHVGMTFMNGNKIWERDNMTKMFPLVDGLSRNHQIRVSEPLSEPKLPKERTRLKIDSTTIYARPRGFCSLSEWGT